MMPTLFHIYGPFAIHSYGLIAACAVIVFMYMVTKDKRFNVLLTHDQFFSLMSIGIICGMSGGRLLFVLSHWYLYTSVWEWFAIWQGGFSVLGGIIALACVMPLYIKKYAISVTSLFDLIAVYAPLFQSIARIGCLLAGCCYGCSTTVPWAILVENIYVHPTQLYSCILLATAFLILYYYRYQWSQYPGLLSASYLMFASAERFVLEFWRANPEIIPVSFLHYLSLQQWIAVSIFFGAGFFLLISSLNMNQIRNEHI